MLIVVDLKEIFLSDGFISISSLISLIANIAILFLTVYTLYITALSRKLKYVSRSKSYNTFFGNSLSVCLMNQSLHAIPIRKIFIMKRCDDGRFKYLKIFERDDLDILEGYNAKRFISDQYSAITDWNEDGKIISPDDLFENSVIGVLSGDKLLWIKTSAKSPKWTAKKAYKLGAFSILTMSGHCYEDRVISDCVNIVIHLVDSDINGKRCMHTIFGITGFDDGKSLLLSDSIRGYSSIPDCGKSPKKIKKAICSQLDINENDIFVERIEERQI